jgi:hypothetical protein
VATDPVDVRLNVDDVLVMATKSHTTGTAVGRPRRWSDATKDTDPHREYWQVP